ncbi:MAG: translation initiation factor IF-1A [Nanoarchaeota archaeon]|nr:translation initiation factor IF-1A [Nanoarchaeota archaeon]MBU1103387.1 translation initiation factor IF-1A [Nanoarchaeota archaeon]
MTDADYGDFEEIKEEESKTPAQPEQQFPSRVKLPKKGQLIGIVLQRLGGKRMSIKTTDNKVRNCRVPGRFSRRFWLRPGHFVIIEPWPDDDNKGDVVFHYKPNAISQLKRQGLLQNLEGEF